MQKKIITAITAGAMTFSTLALQTFAAGDGVIELPIISVTDETDSSTADSVNSQSFLNSSSNSSDSFSYSDSNDTQSDVLKHEHTYGSWITEIQASCTQNGLQYRVCSGCGERETDILDAVGHDFTLETVAPTYVSDGYTEHKCTKCGYSYKDSFKSKKSLEAVAFTSYSSTEKAVRLNWNKVDGATGYRIYMYDASAKKWTSLATVRNSNLTYRKSGLESGNAYFFKVKAFVKENGKTVWGKTGNSFSVVTKPSKAVILKPSVSSSAIRVKWEICNCSGYQIYIYRDGQWKRAKTVTKSDLSNYRISKLNKNTAYKIKVRAFSVDENGKRVYGAFSKTVNVKTKR